MIATLRLAGWRSTDRTSGRRRSYTARCPRRMMRPKEVCTKPSVRTRRCKFVNGSLSTCRSSGALPGRERDAHVVPVRAHAQYEVFEIAPSVQHSVSVLERLVVRRHVEFRRVHAHATGLEALRAGARGTSYPACKSPRCSIAHDDQAKSKPWRSARTSFMSIASNCTARGTRPRDKAVAVQVREPSGVLPGLAPATGGARARREVGGKDRAAVGGEVRRDRLDADAEPEAPPPGPDHAADLERLQDVAPLPQLPVGACSRCRACDTTPGSRRV